MTTWREADPGPCDRCGSTSWLPVVYGYPSFEVSDAAAAGEVSLGGCIIEENSPRHRCRVCGHGPGEFMWWDGASGPSTDGVLGRRSSLRPTDVPGPEAGEDELIAFAHTFDAYEALGAETTLSEGANGRDEYERTQALPDNLVMLRACLFFEARAARHAGEPFGDHYVAVLLEAIRTHAKQLQDERQ